MHAKQLTTKSGHTFEYVSELPFDQAALAIELDARRTFATNRIAPINGKAQVADRTKPPVEA